MLCNITKNRKCSIQAPTHVVSSAERQTVLAKGTLLWDHKYILLPFHNPNHIPSKDTIEYCTVDVFFK